MSITNNIKELYKHNQRWYNCPSCNGKGKLGISEKDNYLIYHCFKCSAKGKVKQNSFRRPYMKVNNVPVGDYQKPFTLPPAAKRTPSTFNLSVLGYLFKYGLGREDILRCKVLSINDELIFPVYKKFNTDSMLTYLCKYQQRNVRNKWIETYYKPGYAGMGWIVGLSPEKYPYTVSDPDYVEKYEDLRIVIVEDGVSAMKVSRKFPCLCLFGTNLSDQMVVQLLRFNPYKIYIWLDNDNWRVVQSRNKMIKKLNSTFPGKVHCVIHESDAKKLSDKEILDTIEYFG